MPYKKTTIYQAMLDAVRTTLENMAFSEVAEQPGEREQPVMTELTWVSILIRDPFQGEVRLAMPGSLLSEMTANMFGLEAEEIEEDQKQDIIAEILNTLTGLFMSELLSDDQTYRLGLPEQGSGPFPQVEEGSLVWNLQVEGQPLLLVATGASLMSDI